MDMNLDFIAKLIGSLALVIGLMLVTLYVMKRQGFSVNGFVQVENSVNVGPKERIMLVKCGNEQILIGVTSTNIRTLHVLDSDAVNPELVAENKKSKDELLKAGNS